MIVMASNEPHVNLLAAQQQAEQQALRATAHSTSESAILESSRRRGRLGVQRRSWQIEDGVGMSEHPPISKSTKNTNEPSNTTPANASSESQ